MKVYRLMCKEELNKIISNDKFSLGSNPEEFSFSESNTHKYERNKKYIHFFLSKKSADYFLSSNNNILCTFNIPVTLLLKRHGFGYYPSKNNAEQRGYDAIAIKVHEFAISADEFNPNWLIKYKKLNTENRM